MSTTAAEQTSSSHPFTEDPVISLETTEREREREPNFWASVEQNENKKEIVTADQSLDQSCQVSVGQVWSLL